MPSTPRRKVKLKDAAQTRAEILLAASMLFSEKGYSQVGLREIAAKAEITAALIVRYFGSKEALFEEALQEAMDLSELLAGSPMNFGQDMVRFIQHHNDTSVNPLSMQILAIADPTSRAVATRVLQKDVLKILTHWLSHRGTPQKELPQAANETRAALITTVLSGVWLYRDLLPLPALAEELSPPVAAWLADTLQGIVDGSAG